MTITREEILTKAFLDEAFVYKDGFLFWKERPSHHFAEEWIRGAFNKRFAHKQAGYSRNGYRFVDFPLAKKVGVHRIVFVLHHGFVPETVDHIDGDTNNNRVENLRAATRRQNSMNTTTPSRNTSGVKGVSFHKNTNKWAAFVRVDGRQVHLGVFASIDEARKVRVEAAKQSYGEFFNDR